MRHPHYLVLLSILTLSSAHAHAASVTTGASRDNTLYAEFDTLSNGAGQTFFAGRNGLGDARRALIRFDLTGLVPVGATVDSVVLQLRLSNTQPGSHPVSLHRALADWGEGTSDAAGGEGAGAPATPGDITWLQRFFGASQPWSTPGGDYAPAASATRPVGAVAFYAWRSPAMSADVEFWRQNPSSNFGWLMLGDETVGAAGVAKRFESRQSTTAVNRPSLTIYYTQTSTAAGPLPGAVRLFPVHPNPFNPSASIRYELATTQHVTVSVYDIAGRLVRTLVNGVMPVGTNETMWRGEDARGNRVASGVYVVRLTAANAAPRTEKMVLLK
jgi:FlgD Ig-like domain